MRATLGFGTESRWDSTQLVSMVGVDVSLPLWISAKRQIFEMRPKLNTCRKLSRHWANQNAVLVLKSAPFPGRGAFQKSDALGQKRGGFETLLEASPMCVAQLTEREHSCPLPPQRLSSASLFSLRWMLLLKRFVKSRTAPPWERRRPRRLPER